MRRAQANGLLLLAALLWGAGNVAQKTVLEDIGPFTAVGLRCLIAALVLAPFFAPAIASPKAGEIKCAAMVIAAFAVAVTLYQMASGLTTVTNTGFLVNTSTVFTPIAGWLLLRLRTGYMVWPAAGLTLLGAFMMSGEIFVRLNPGDALAIAAAFFYSLWMIYLGQFVTRHGHAGLITLAQFALTGLACLAIGLNFEPVSIAGLRAAVPELLMLGVVSTGMGYLLQAIAQGYTSASEAAVIVSGEAIFGALCAFILLGETLNNYGLIGAALIIGGIVTMQFQRFTLYPSLHSKGEQS
jgi:drug/metabolite transporter (DMT)-like permease